MNHRYVCSLVFYIALTLSSLAQNVTTTGGATNTIPKFSGSTTLTNSVITETNGSIGIGTVMPVATLGVAPTFTDVSGTASQGIDVYALANPTSSSSSSFYGGVLTISPQPGGAQNFTGGFTGGALQAYHEGSGTVAWEVGADGEIYNLSSGTISDALGIQAAVTNTSSGSIATAEGIYSQVNNRGSGTITNGYGIYVDSPSNSGGGQFANYYGLYLATPTVGSTAYSLYSAGGTSYFNGNVGVGTTSPGAKLEVDGNVKLTSGSGASITFADGTVQSSAWTGTLCGGDYAEAVSGEGERASYEPGDVLVLNDSDGADVTRSTEPYSTAVAGIYSTRPGLIGRRQATKSGREIPMAMVGIVPTKVSAENGPIRRGDLLVTSSMAGYAMKGTDRSKMLGAIVGKAMGDLESGTGVVEVLVSLQ